MTALPISGAGWSPWIDPRRGREGDEKEGRLEHCIMTEGEHVWQKEIVKPSGLIVSLRKERVKRNRTSGESFERRF